MPSVDSQMATQRSNSGQLHCEGAIDVDITEHQKPYRVVVFHFYGDGITGIFGVLASAVTPFHMLDQLVGRHFTVRRPGGRPCINTRTKNFPFPVGFAPHTGQPVEFFITGRGKVGHELDTELYELSVEASKLMQGEYLGHCHINRKDAYGHLR